MASLLETNICNFLFFSSLFLITTVKASVSSHQLSVGGKAGWIKPSKNESDTYVNWAKSNKFHVGDSIYFKYEKDSVLLVNPNDYNNCSLKHPLSKFKDGNTVFHFERYGLFYFISGEPGHCEAGQKVAIQVLEQPKPEPPESAPVPESSGNSGGGSGTSEPDQFGPPRPNSTVRLTVESYFFAVLGWVVVIRYVFM